MLVRLVKIAIPISLGSIVANVAQFIDTFTIIRRLDAAFQNYPAEMMKLFGSIIPAETLAENGAANFIYGSYSGYALSIFNLVPAFTIIFGKSALPNVTAAWTARDMKGVRINIESLIRMTTLIAAPLSLGIFSMAEPILSLLYPSKAAEVAIAAPVLSFQGIALIFLGLTSPLFAALQAMGRADLPPQVYVIGCGAEVRRKLCNNRYSRNQCPGCGGRYNSLLCCHLCPVPDMAGENYRNSIPVFPSVLEADFGRRPLLSYSLRST